MSDTVYVMSDIITSANGNKLSTLDGVNGVNGVNAEADTTIEYFEIANPACNLHRV